MNIRDGFFSGPSALVVYFLRTLRSVRPTIHHHTVAHTRDHVIIVTYTHIHFGHNCHTDGLRYFLLYYFFFHVVRCKWWANEFYVRPSPSQSIPQRLTLVVLVDASVAGPIFLAAAAAGHRLTHLQHNESDQPSIWWHRRLPKGRGMSVSRRSAERINATSI